jgi:rhodanese-related sulfurtransferase
MTALIVLVAGFGASQSGAFQWFLLKASLRTKFPQVQWITTQQLADWLADSSRQQPVLLDVRTAEEWAASHLPGARRVEPRTPPEDALKGMAKDTPIVTYCAVGYRSGEMATRLREAGFNNVHNLEGSIFQWANEDRLLVREGRIVKRVHPYSDFWGKLLEDDVRAPLEK